eukprot:SAG31_NODE_28186_length_414_cov_0.961905_1_plen_49_part_10
MGCARPAERRCALIDQESCACTQQRAQRSAWWRVTDAPAGGNHSQAMIG